MTLASLGSEEQRKHLSLDTRLGHVVLNYPDTSDIAVYQAEPTYTPPMFYCTKIDRSVRVAYSIL